MDRNAHAREATATPVENIFWPASSVRDAPFLHRWRDAWICIRGWGGAIATNAGLVPGQAPKGRYRFWVEAVDMERSPAPTPYPLRAVMSLCHALAGLTGIWLALGGADACADI